MINHEHILGILPGHVRLHLQHLAKCLIKIINLFLAKLFLNQDLLLSHLHLHRINFLLRDLYIIIVGAGFVLALLGILLVEEFVLDLLVVGFLLSLLLSALLIFVLFKIIVEVCKLLKQVVVFAHVVVRHEVLGA